MNAKNEYSQLTIKIKKWDQLNFYSVNMLSCPFGSDVETQLFKERPLIHIDHPQLTATASDPMKYGQLLSRMFFAPDAIRSGFTRVVSEAIDHPLRICLWVAASAMELHALLWETLADPEGLTPLFQGDRFLFSRYLTGYDWRSVRMVARSDMKALVAIANPKDLDDYQLSELDSESEHKRAATALGGMRTNFLEQPVTLSRLASSLGESPDILYLVCHGSFRKGESWLWLENEKGMVARCNGDELLKVVKNLTQLPRIAVLITCESAGVAAEDANLAALGPRLAECGIPAVVAMQGKVSFQTIETFMTHFFAELRKDGHLDRAMGVARRAVTHCVDWWMPVLYLRLKSGYLWYAPGFSGERLKKWPTLIRQIQRGSCTPILGPGLTNSLFGPRETIAREWAREFQFPMAAHQQDALSHVAQYLSINQDSMFPYDELELTLQRQLQRRHGHLLPAEMTGLQEQTRHVGQQLRKSEKANAYRVLADLKCPMYVTTDPTFLLEDALRERGASPQAELCRWNRDLERLPSIFKGEDVERSSADNPLIYRLFGSLDMPESMVLTEDDYFDFLIGVTSNADLIPFPVRRALTDTALLFLGFRMEDREFRVLFRGLMNREGSDRRRRYAHVAAQIDPADGNMLEAQGARKYLETYFGDANISIYWGSVEDFLGELQDRLGSEQ